MLRAFWILHTYIPDLYYRSVLRHTVWGRWMPCKSAFCHCDRCTKISSNRVFSYLFIRARFIFIYSFFSKIFPIISPSLVLVRLWVLGWLQLAWNYAAPPFEILIMLSMMRPAQSNSVSSRPFSQRFLVEESLQTKKRRKDQIGVIPQSAPISHAARLSSAPVSTSLPPVHQHPFQEFSKNMIDYFTLLNTRLISDFLRCDKCYKVSDR